MTWLRDLLAPAWRRYTFIGLLALMSVLIGLRLLAFTPFAQSWVEARIEALSISGQSVQVDDLRGDLIGRLSIARLSIADEDGTWMVVQDVDLDWSPLALIGGHLSIQELTADLVSVSRQPVMVTAEPRQPRASSGSSGRLDLDAFEIRTLNLAGGVAGPAQSYSIFGALNANGARGGLDLRLQPTGAAGDMAQINLDWGGDVPLIGDATVQGAPYGFVAALLGLTNGQGFSATVSASGDTNDWEFAAQARVDEADVIDLRASLQEGSYRGDGDIILTPFRPFQSIRDRLGDKVRVEGVYLADQSITGRLVTDNGEIDLDGRLVHRESGLQVQPLTVTARDLNMAAVSGVSQLTLPTATFIGSYDSESGQSMLQGALAIPSLAYESYGGDGLSINGVFQLSDGEVLVASTFDAEEVSGLPEAILREIDNGIAGTVEARLNTDAGRLDVRSLTLESDGHRLTGSGTRSQSGALDLAGQIELDTVSVFEGIDGDWRIVGALDDELAISFGGGLVPAASSSELIAAFGDRADVALNVRAQAGQYEIDTFSLRSDSIFADASGALSDGALALDAQIASDALTINQISFDDFAADVSVSGTMADPIVAIEMRAAEVRTMGEVFAAPTLTAFATIDPVPEIALQIDTDYRGAPLVSSLTAILDGPSIDVRDLSVQWSDLVGSGQAALDLEAIETSTVALDLQGQAPFIGDLSGDATFEAQTLGLNVTTRDADFGALALNQATLSLSGQWPRFEGALDYAGNLPVWDRRESLSGQQTLDLDVSERRLSVGGETMIAGQNIVIQSPIELTLDTGAQVSGSLSTFGGEVDLRVDVSGQTPSQIALRGLQMSQLGVFVDRPGLEGVLSGDTRIEIIEDALMGEADLAIAGLSRGAGEAADLSVSSALEAGALIVQLTGTNDTGELEFDAQLQTALTHQGDLLSIRPDPLMRMPIQVTGSGPVAALWALVAPSDLRLEGDFTADLNNGDGSDFRFSGPVTWQNGVFEDGFTGLHLTNVSASADLSPAAITLSRATASGINGGTLNGSGKYSFTGDSDIVLELDQLNANNRSDVQARISGRTTLDRRNRRTHIQGDLEIDRAQINLSNLPGAGYTTLDVVFMEGDERPLTDAPAREAISLDVTLRSDRRIFVNGPGTESEWGMNVRITGPAGAPQLNGTATLIRGDVDLLSRSFRMSDGTVRFLGAPEESAVSLQADRTNDGITTSILVTGPVTSPSIDLTSDPSLPEDEILARVLFGRSPTNLSPLQAAQLAAAAAQLAGGNAFSLTGELEAATGLDRLDFGFDDNGAATLSTGKYLADDLYLEVESASSGAPGVALEWTPLNNVEVDAEIDPELGPKVAVQWRLDFDRLPGETPREKSARDSGND
ncbi:MAG: translocation/assembly module TamB domain-containing protein [Pseudomonadota bacterium]